jgi:hypothetical protein
MSKTHFALSIFLLELSKSGMRASGTQVRLRPEYR